MMPPLYEMVIKPGVGYKLVFIELYTLAEWPTVGLLFEDKYTISPYPQPFTKIFEEKYTW